MRARKERAAVHAALQKIEKLGQEPDYFEEGWELFQAALRLTKPRRWWWFW
jgi:hypothetical protein